MLAEFKPENIMGIAYIKSHEGDWTNKQIVLPSGIVIPPPLPRMVWMVVDGVVMMTKEPVDV